MTILYLHGLMSSPQTPKVDWLRELGHTVVSPLLDYKNQSASIFTDLQTACKQHTFDLIIGSSMGGYLGYHLGNYYDIPTLLFNPSLAENEIQKPEKEETENKVLLHTIILGKQDAVVIPEATLKYLETHQVNFEVYWENYGHRTPIESFKKYAEKIMSNVSFKGC
jgi:uncharacterized protein